MAAQLVDHFGTVYFQFWNVVYLAWQHHQVILHDTVGQRSTPKYVCGTVAFNPVVAHSFFRAKIGMHSSPLSNAP